MPEWAIFPWQDRMFTSSDEALLTHAVASVENAAANKAGGFSRLPGLEWFVQFPADRVYLKRWRNDLYAGTDRGKLYRISQDQRLTDMTGVPVSGGRRWTFDIGENPDMLLMAAGGPIVKLSNLQTEVLSPQAPNTTHVAVVDGYVMAIEPHSNRFSFADVDRPTVWDPLSVFSANAKAEDANSLVITPYREVLIGAPEHIEQYERLANGDQPFARRWSTGQGVGFPYTLLADVTGTYGVNSKHEFVRFFGQVSQEKSQDVRRSLEDVDDWTDAWSGELAVDGGRYMVLQMPFATNPYGTKGLTFTYDYSSARWAFLYGPLSNGLPTRYPAWSFERCWNKVFVGVPGGVAIMDPSNYQMFGAAWPFLVRTAHVDKYGPSRFDNLRIRIKRGAAQQYPVLRNELGAPLLAERTRQPLRNEAKSPEPRLLGLRVNRDNEGFGPWMYEPMDPEGETTLVANFGAMGCANTWQFEMRCTSDTPVETTRMEVYVERLRW